MADNLWHHDVMMRYVVGLSSRSPRAMAVIKGITDDSFPKPVELWCDWEWIG
jgi:hypothetical protein